jgi:hypothetical protein
LINISSYRVIKNKKIFSALSAREDLIKNLLIFTVEYANRFSDHKERNLTANNRGWDPINGLKPSI